MPFRKIKDEIEACAFNKINNRKIRRICHLENLENRKREKEIQSKNIPKDRRLERLQIQDRLKKKIKEREKELNEEKLEKVMRELIGPDCKSIELGDEFIVCPGLSRVVWGTTPNFNPTGLEPIIRKRKNEEAIIPSDLDEREKKEKNRLKNKIWQKNSNIVPNDLDERIEKYLNSKK